MRKIYYEWHLADIPVLLGIGNFKKDARNIMRQFMAIDELSDIKLFNSVYHDICNSFYKYKTTPLEYFLFGFRNKDESERDLYISDRFIMKYVADKSGRILHDNELNNKYNFYLINKSTFNRKVMLFDNSTTLEQLSDFSVNLSRFISKPNTSALGSGVKIFNVGNELDIKNVFEQLKGSGMEYVLEEVIIQHEQMAIWNDTSVNTIRINSFLSNGKFNILCPFIRTGRKGSIVDNGGQGGIFASIDKVTGIICTDGMDEKLNTYEVHPDSAVRYKGQQIPLWQDLLEVTEKCHRNMAKHSYISWDFALTDKGWVLIEGNWGEFVCQQMTNKRGYKKEFMKYLNA